jgi:signal peptidase I
MSKKEILSFATTLFAALFCAAIIRSFFFEPFFIPSGSMKPNLLIGDYVIVTKYSYGYSRYSFPFSPELFSGRIFSDQGEKKPQRGDVVVFRFPPDPSINYIKRVIGLPGDMIQMRDGVLYINNEKVEKIANGEFIDGDSDSPSIKIDRFNETMPDGKRVVTLDMTVTPQDNTGIYQVPEGYYFMMGDNRDNSQDSRFLDQVGFVPEENLVGKARFIFFSDAKPIWQFWHWPTSIRWQRIFEKISSNEMSSRNV